ncbi:sialidase family protein [Actinomadura sp. 6N118]|uniref:sialidase family protein n=1 Tax=Actinomadura sp. 6N118 TaxID=3375151 RepID=UPI003787F24A
MRRSATALTGALALVVSSAVGAAAGPITAGPPVQVSPTGSPFPGAGPTGAPCNGVPGSAQTGTNFPGTEVEPWVSVNPRLKANLIGGWQQDRWSNGGANANLAAYSLDGGRNWRLSALQPRHARCTGGTAANKGDYERATDPWTSISPNGTAYFMSLALDIAQDANHAMLVSRSTDGGRTWGPTTELRRDTSPNILNDKNSLTADRFDSRFAYAIWDRLEIPDAQAAAAAKTTDGRAFLGRRFNSLRSAGPGAPTEFRGPTWFARTTDGGRTWRRARPIFDPGAGNQTIGNQIVQAGDRTLVNGFDLIFDADQQVSDFNIAAQRSTDRGASWGRPVIVDRHRFAGVTDPTTGAPVRTGDILPSIAADPRPGSKTVYMVWQDARATGGARDQIALAKSTDGGRTWRTLSYGINKVTSTQAFTAAIAVLPDGTVGVLHYDFRNDNAAAPLTTSTLLLHSHDGGRTFSETKIGADFDMSGAAAAGGFFVGDYIGLGTSPGRFHPFYGVATGTPAAPAGNIYATTAR